MLVLIRTMAWLLNYGQSWVLFSFSLCVFSAFPAILFVLPAIFESEGPEHKPTARKQNPGALRLNGQPKSLLVLILVASLGIFVLILLPV